MVPILIPKYFYAACDYAEKQILARPIEIQKENWGVTMHFLEIIKQQ